MHLIRDISKSLAKFWRVKNCTYLCTATDMHLTQGEDCYIAKLHQNNFNHFGVNAPKHRKTFKNGVFP